MGREGWKGNIMPGPVSKSFRGASGKTPLVPTWMEDRRADWQKRQGAACTCLGTDEYCPCQNVERSVQ